MFWRFGILNAWRNLDRSLLAIVSIAIAAAFMTNAVVYSRGYPKRKDAQYRALIGGEISAYSINFNLSSPDEDVLWQYQEFAAAQNTDLAWMMPELAKEGYVSTINDNTFFDEETITALSELPYITGVYPRYQMPALSCSDFGVWSTPLRGRDLALDAQQTTPLSDYITQGRWFNREDEGGLVAVVCTQQHYPPGQHNAAVGDILRLNIPRIVQVGESYRYDYNNPIHTELSVIGTLDAVSRQVSWYGNKEYRTDIAIVSDEIHIPLTTWQGIWQKAGGAEYVPQQLGLMLEENSYLEDAALELRLAFPEVSFYSVPQMVRRNTNLFTMESMERPLVDPFLAERVARRNEPEQAVLVQDLRLPLTILIFLNAALVVASHLLIIAAGRAREIGILKSIGATRKDIVESVLGEALLLSIIGGLSGFLFFRIPAVLNQLTNGVSFAGIATSFLSDMALTVGLACACSILFAMIPALWTTRFSVREILQGDSV